MGLLYSNYECKPVTNNSTKINAVSGTLTKTFKKSYFKRFEKDSVCEYFYFRENKPSRIISKDYHCTSDGESYKGYYYNLKEIVVLQIMLCADDSYLVEAIDKEDYEEMFEKLESNNERSN